MLPVWLTDTVTSDLERALHYTLLWGLEGVELRTVGGAEERVPHVNETKIKRRLEKADILPVSIAPSIFEGTASRRAAILNRLVTFDDTLRFADRIGSPRVVVSAFARGDGAPLEPAADALRRAGEAASEYGITIAVLNETGMARPTGQELAVLLEAVDHPFVRAAWNPAAALRAGEDPADGLEALKERVTLVRCADGRVTGQGWQELPFGQGDIDWEAQLQTLDAVGFQGPLSLEIYVEPRPKVGLRSATRLIEMIRTVRSPA